MRGCLAAALAMLLACVPRAFAAEPRVFGGYEEFYASLGQSLFKPADARALHQGTAPSGHYRLFWAGPVGTKRIHSVELADADLVIDKRVLAAEDATRFPG